MKMTFVINDLTVGGAQRLFIELANRLARKGHDVRLVALSTVPGKLDLVREIDDSVSWVRLEFSGAWSLAGWKSLFAQLRDRQGGVVFTTLFFANAAVRMLALCCRFRQRTVVVEQNTYDDKPLRFIVLDWLLSWITARIICTSETVKAFTAHQEHIPERRFTVIHSGVDAGRLLEAASANARARIRAEFAIPDAAILLLDVARLTEQKDHMLLLAAFNELCTRLPERDLRLVLVGEGRLRDSLEARTRELGIAHAVYFAGARYDVASFYAAADYFISTSRIEGFSLVHAEAMVFGLPIITTRTAGPDVMVLDGKTGFFVEHTPESVAEGCEAAFASDYDALQRAAYERSKYFTIDKTADQYEHVAATLAHE